MKRRDALLYAFTSTAPLPQMLAKTHRFTASDISNSKGLQYGAMVFSTVSKAEDFYASSAPALNYIQNAMA
jgi:hypothetical protein